MSKHQDTDPRDTAAPSPSRKARLHRLLFAGAALGTTLLALGAASEPKLPPFQGE
ncbi:MAG TPA: hypothetical protein VGD37_32425 [Kofleriaceae bacterium]|jgi:hypothetical protein